MPFAITDEQKKPTDQQGANIAGTTTALNIPGQNAGISKTAQAAPKQSGQYQNIQKYLAANEPQGTQMGQQIAQGVEQKVSGAQQAGQALQSSIKAPEAYDPNKVLSNLPGATEEQKAQYKAEKATGGYTGPTTAVEAQPYGEFQTKSEAAKEAVGQAGTEVGQQQLLKQQFSNQPYSQGANALDQALLMGSQGGRQAISALGQKYSGLTDLLGGYQTGTEANIAAAQKAAEANKAAFQPAEQAAQAAILSPIEQRVAEANRQADIIKGYGADVTDLTLSPETMAALGLTAGQRTYGVKLGNYINPQLAPAEVQNIATQEERQKFNDLLNLLGTNAGQLGLGEPTYEAPSVNKAGLATAISSQSAKMADQLKQIGGTGDYKTDVNNMNNQITMTNNDLGALNELLNMHNSGHQYSGNWDNLINHVANKYPMVAMETPGTFGFDSALKTAIAKANQQKASLGNQLNQYNTIANMYGYNQQVRGQ